MSAREREPVGPGAPLSRRSLWVAALIGAALMAAADEIVFHQLLAWHHFYDRSTPAVGLLADGLLHTAEVLGLVAGFVLFSDLRRRGALSPGHARAGLLLGLGGFQLFDGVVDHKVLRTHQVRYGVELLPYDLAWNGFAVVLLAAGAVLAVRADRASRRPPGGPVTGRYTALAAGGPDLSPGQLLTALAAWAAAAGYLAAAARLRRRGDRWPWRRDLSFTSGGLALAAAPAVPLPGGPFTAHMAQHVLAGMAAPLLLVLARPVTLALRTLPPGSARRGLLAAVRSRPAAWLVFPPLAALLDVGGLWVLYRTGLFAASHHEPLPHSLVHLHVVAAGLLFSFAVCAPEPLRHPWGLAWRGTTLLLAGAAHAVLAKSLYAVPPPGTGFGTADLRTGSQLMYYGGDLVELALAAVLAVQWYAATGRARSRAGRSTGAAGTGSAGAPRRPSPAESGGASP